MPAVHRLLCCCFAMVLAGCHLIVPYEPVQQAEEAGAMDQGGVDLSGPPEDLPKPPPDKPGPPPDLPKPPQDKPGPLQDLPKPPPDSFILCPAGWTMCGKACRDLNKDSNNCGACGTICDDKNPCTQNECTKGKCNHPAEPTGTKCTGGACAKVPTPTCCTGCLFGDKCIKGTGSNRCGKGGAKCEACAFGLICDKRACKCLPKSGCTGCCNTAGDKCVPPSNSQCGINGVTCQDCTKNPTKKICQPSSGTCGLGTTPTCITNCATGCCSGSSCKAGNTNGHCGKVGAVCENCLIKMAPECVQSYKCNWSKTCEAINKPPKTPCATGYCCNGVCKNSYSCP